MEGPTVARREQPWQPYMVRGTIGGVVFGPAGQLAARTTYGVTVHVCKINAPRTRTYPYKVSATKQSSLQPVVP